MAYSPLKKGDLGIHKLSTFNQAISGKWLWSFGVKKEHLWRCYFSETWRYTAGWSMKSVRGGWNAFLLLLLFFNDIGNLSKGGLSSPLTGKTYRQPIYIKFIIGNGSCSHLAWSWCEDCPLKDLFHEQFRLAVDNNTSIVLNQEKKRMRL